MKSFANILAKSCQSSSNFDELSRRFDIAGDESEFVSNLAFHCCIWVQSFHSRATEVYRDHCGNSNRKYNGSPRVYRYGTQKSKNEWLQILGYIICADDAHAEVTDTCRHDTPDKPAEEHRFHFISRHRSP